MEEVHVTRKVVRKEAGQAAEEISGFTRRMEERFRSVMDAEVDNTSQTPITHIQKVPFMLRDTNSEKYFKPRVVSIGPYHHGRDELEPMEMLKLKFTKQLIINHLIHPIDFLCKQIFSEIKQLRACYEESTKKYDDEALAWMLFVDGCFVLHYIDCWVKGKPNDLNIKDHYVAFVCQDLFLLENQLPFRVLELLMKEGFGNNKWMETIELFIQSNIEIPKVKGRKRWQQRLRRWRWQQHLRQQQQKESTKEGPSHLLELLRKRLIGSNGIEVKNEEDDWHSFRNVTELTATGIHLAPSKTNCLTDVSFKPWFIYGFLRLPPLRVDDSTRAKFLNLIAYEMSSDFVKNTEVTSYICFLNSLIDYPDDVKMLRKKRILYNFLGSDEEVVKLFNEIATNLVPNFDIYKDVKTKIKNHYNDKAKSWMAQFIHDHFSGNWVIYGFILGIYTVILSTIQTYFTIHGPLPGECDGLCKNHKKRYI